MKILGIIVEYNPMHNGHIYQINKAKKLVNPDYTIIIMSGNFTQQGNISILDKFTKAEIAIQNGVDLVIELPTIYATSSAEYFATGAINILNSLGCITHLAFGAECNDINSLNDIAKCMNNNYEDIIESCKMCEDKSTTSAFIHVNALRSFLTAAQIEILSRPNNILAIQYLRQLLKLNSSISPVLIERSGTNHNSKDIHNNIASSTRIRELLSENNYSSIDMLVPLQVSKQLVNIDTSYKERFWNILKYEILKLQAQGLNQISEISEGLENRILKFAEKANNYDEFLTLVKTKRYTLGRIKRICINILLNKTKYKFNCLRSIEYVRVLKVSSSKSQLLSILSKQAAIPIVTKMSSCNSSDINCVKALELDIMATKLHNLIFHTTSNDYTNPIILEN